MPVLGLIFLRYAESRYEMAEKEILKEHPVRPGREFKIRPGTFSVEKRFIFGEGSTLQLFA